MANCGVPALTTSSPGPGKFCARADALTERVKKPWSPTVRPLCNHERTGVRHWSLLSTVMTRSLTVSMVRRPLGAVEFCPSTLLPNGSCSELRAAVTSTPPTALHTSDGVICSWPSSVVRKRCASCCVRSWAASRSVANAPLPNGLPGPAHTPGLARPNELAGASPRATVSRQLASSGLAR